jgi:endonuclease/exonuclease/phosphatase family metal-dependent hydrolase
MRIVTYNLHFATRVGRALDVIRSEPDLAADLMSLQEVDGPAVEQMAGALGMQSAWHPAAIHRRTGRHFAPAVLSRWPIVENRLLELPHPGLHGLVRVAVHARIERGPGDVIDFVAVHFGTMREIRPGQQEDQAKAVLEAVADRKGPVIVAGDLNRMGLGRLFEALVLTGSPGTLDSPISCGRSITCSLAGFDRPVLARARSGPRSRPAITALSGSSSIS